MALARFRVLVAYDTEGGMAREGQMPWNHPEDLQFFRRQTLHGTVIMGHRTYDHLPASVRPLPQRRNIVLSHTPQDLPGVEVARSLVQALEWAATTPEQPTFIIGGAVILQQVLQHWLYLCDGFLATELTQAYACDCRLDLALLRERCTPQPVGGEDQPPPEAGYARVCYVPKAAYQRHEEEEYLSLLRRILETGTDRGDRTGVGTRSLFGARMEFDLRASVPVLTTKRVFWKKVVGELLWFLSGSTSVEDLHAANIHFWDANSSREFLDQRGLSHYEEGDLGPVYGFQWRHWGAAYQGHRHDYTGEGVDQVAEVLRLLRDDPFSRRILLSAWNVGDLPHMALPPCHLLAQFYVREEDGVRYLDCQMYQRSGDMFLGVPFNITCYSTLVVLLAHLSHMQPGRFIHVLGDAHIYLNHLEAVEQQLANTPRPFPVLHLRPDLARLEDVRLEDVELRHYEPARYISAPMAV